MVTLTHEQLMSSYPILDENTVQVVAEGNVKDQLDATEPSTVQTFINSQPSTQESTQTDLQASAKLEAVDSQRQSLSSQSSSVGSVSSASTIIHDSDDPQTQLYVTELVKRAKSYLEEGNSESEASKTLISELLTTLVKVRGESDQYKIKAKLLSISSKDADMRYEVENELIKRQVERLKSQGENMDGLMNKLSHQKLTLKKYKNEIINKNKEIIRLRSKQADQKKKRKSDSTHAGMLDTLGMLASQVLTEEEKTNREQRTAAYVLPKLNSFKHGGSQSNGNGPDETTISEYSVN